MKKEIKDLSIGLLALGVVFAVLCGFTYVLVDGTGKWYRTCITTKVC